MDESSLLSQYKTRSAISNDGHVLLVEHMPSEKLYVKKTLSVYNKAIYEQLMAADFPGVPKIFNIFEVNNELIVIEEYIQGTTLLEKLEKSGALDENMVARYISELCTIVSMLHNSNPAIIHRDIKPSNIIIDQQDHPILIDFNAARPGIFKEEDTNLLGTKGYAAPEQFGFGSSDERTDIYALGMVANTLLNGKISSSVYQGSRLTDIIQRCTKLEPADRYDSVLTLKNEIDIQFHFSPEKEPAIKRRYIAWLPPGFRSLTPWRMAIATPVYVLIFFAVFSRVFYRPTPTGTIITRLTALSVALAIIACTCNYMGIQKIMPLCRSGNKFHKIAGVMLLTLLTGLAILLIGLLFANSF